MTEENNILFDPKVYFKMVLLQGMLEIYRFIYR